MTNNSESSARSLQRAGEIIIRYGLVVVIFWIGCLKFTAYEAHGVSNYATNTPLLSWAYDWLGERNFSRLLGCVEIAIALLIATRPALPIASAIGSLGAIVMFLTTLSFFLTTPGIWQPDYGFPALSPAPGQFLLKDLVNLGAAVWTAGEALLAASARRR
ncbi:MAG: DUF417 family protein [Bryobacteraceae bacterium]